MRWTGLRRAVVLLLLARCFRRPSRPLRHRPGQPGDLTVTVSATGNLAPTNQVNVGSEESGLIDEVYVQNNDQVTKGQPLAQLDLRACATPWCRARPPCKAAPGGGGAGRGDGRAGRRRTSPAMSRCSRLSGGKVPSQTELDTARGRLRPGVRQRRPAEAQVAQAQARRSRPTRPTSSKAPSMRR